MLKCDCVFPVSSIPRVTRLLKCGVSPNASDGATSDNKVLHWAASYGTDEMVKLLCGKSTSTGTLNTTRLLLHALETYVCCFY